MANLPPVFIEFIGNYSSLKRTVSGVKTELAEVESTGGGSVAKLGAVSQAALLGIGVAAGAAAVKTVHMAADFQTQMQRVQTGAGEAAGNMRMVGDGVLAMAGQVGQSTEQLTSGLYTVESAGYHGSDALNVLKVAAQGAKVGAADLAPVTDAVTTALNAYSLKASDATGVMNALVATEAAGKTNMEALAGSMSSILPVASAAHVSLNEVMGAMATMTAQGTSADVAATYLRQTIGQLSNPSGKAAQEMQSLGLSAVKVSQNLGTNGLASTLNMLTNAIQSKMGPAGTVLVEHLQKAAASSTDFQKVLAQLPPAQQTYIGALATMVGGTKSMQAALQLTGPHMETFKQNTADIAEHVKRGGTQVEGWAEVQKTFNQRMAEAKASLEAIGIQIGQALLPVATKMIGVFSTSVTWLTKHHNVAIALGAAVGGILVVGLAAATVAMWSFTESMLANPTTWIVAGVMLLIAAIVLLAMHWRQVWGWIKEIAGDVGNWLVGAWHWIANETSSIWHNDIVAPVVGAWHDVEHFFASAWHTVADSVTGAWHWIGHETSHIWNDDIVAPVVGAWRATEKFFASAWHTVADPIVAGWRWIEHETSAVWNGITAFFRKWWPLLLVIFATPIAVLMSIWNHCHTAIENTARAIWGRISAFFEKSWADLCRGADIAWRLITKYVVDPSKEAWRWLEKIWNEATDWLSAKWRDVSDAASASWAWIGHEAKEGWQLVVSYIIDPLKEMWQWLQHFWQDDVVGLLKANWIVLGQLADAGWRAIKDYIVKPLQEAWDWVANFATNIGVTLWNGMVDTWRLVEHIGDSFESIGSNIVNGIITGIENDASYLFKSLKNLANDALNAAKSFLGINSPSRVFAAEVGQWIPHGIAAGIDQHAGVAARAVSSMASGTLGQFASVGGAEPAFAGGTVGSAGSSGSGPVTVVNVTVSGSVISAERDLTNTIQKVMAQYGARNSSTYTPFRR
jgi:TP901 family phage tail tape measure protein